MTSESPRSIQLHLGDDDGLMTSAHQAVAEHAVNKIPNLTYVGETDGGITFGDRLLRGYNQRGLSGFFDQLTRPIPERQHVYWEGKEVFPYSTDSFANVGQRSQRNGWNLRYADQDAYGLNDQGRNRKFSELNRYLESDASAQDKADAINEKLIRRFYPKGSREAYVDNTGQLRTPQPFLFKGGNWANRFRQFYQQLLNGK